MRKFNDEEDGREKMLYTWAEALRRPDFNVPIPGSIMPIRNKAELFTGTRNYILTLLDQTYLLTLLFSLLVNKREGLFQDLKKEMILITSRHFCLAQQGSLVPPQRPTKLVNWAQPL